jgi:alpha-galactosidase
LKSRYGLKLGLWIAPTDAAETSDVFKQHLDWMLKDQSGKPLVNWKWYWKPNPNCFELDATNPAAAKYIRDTFARLSAEGSSYFKIDFIASSGGEQFFQSDLAATRGWGNLRRAMQCVRDGAGESAWIRYCQTPPLLSTGLADSAYGGDDTLDAGVPNTFHVLRDNARSLAAGYWINDRLYHREVCDMSVRMQADVEEVRVRVAIMALAGCSISFSDELQHLPPSRIAMMQQVLPPGAPAMRPIDLFDREVPSIWHLHCRNDAGEWETVGLFNFEDSPQPRTVDFAALGLEPDKPQAIFEFWEQKFLGVERGKFTMTLAPHTSRILSIRRLTGSPQVIGTDMHVLQGVHELLNTKWDAASAALSGRCRRAAGLRGRVFIYVPDAYSPRFDFPLRPESAHLTHLDGPLWARELEFDSTEVDWTVPFARSK